MSEEHSYHEGCPRCWDRHQAVVRRSERLEEALRRLVSYTRACEGLINASPAGQVLEAEKLLGIVVREDPAVPRGEIRFVNPDGTVAGKIVGLKEE